MNTQRLEAGFYAKSNLRNVEQSLRSETAQQSGMDAVQQLLQLQANPELGRLMGFDIELNNRAKCKKNTVICRKITVFGTPKRT